MNYNMRKNVTVVSKMKAEGGIIPLSLIWEDGREFTIDKVIDVRKKASTKGGGMGIRYTVRIKGNERFLFLDEYVWFIEI